NEIWVDFTAAAGERVIGRSGALTRPDDSGTVDPWAHFVNVLMLDRDGNRINRRNPQDIFTPLYNHQIPPGAAQVVHYRLEVPKDLDPKEPVTLKVRLRFRKFDFEYMSLVHGTTVMVQLPLGFEVTIPGDEKARVPQLPVVDLCEDAVTLPITGGPEVAKQLSPIKPPWQRWNDYGIACLIEGGVGTKK